MACSSTKYEIEKFDGTNDFAIWKLKMLALLGNLGLDEALEGESKMPADYSDEKKKDIMKRAYNTLILSLSDKVIREITKMKTVAEVWLKLESLYMTKTLSSRLYLKAKFFTFKMADGKNLHDHMDEFNKLCLDLENINVEYDDEDKALVLLHSLPKSYETFVDILKHGRETLSLEDVIGALNSKDLQRKNEQKEQSGDSLIVRGRTDKRDQKGKSRTRSKSKNGKKIIKCYYCHEEGHIRRLCPKRKKETKDKETISGDAAVVEEGYESSDVLVVTTNNSDKQWILDSGCSFHMTPNRDWFESYEDRDGGQVLLGNNKACKVTGIGSIRIRTHDGIERLLTEVRFIPELKRNLISLGLLDQNGYTYKCEDGILKICRGSMVVMKGIRENGLYVLQGSTVIGIASPVISNDSNSAQTWHKRLGHVSERGLQELQKQGLLNGRKLGKMGFCEDCIYGKATRVKFSSSVYKTREILNYVHSDLWGPSKTESFGGGRYFISIIDDCSRKVWVYILKSKDQAFQKFKDWKKMVELQTGKKVKKLRTDNGLEYLNEEFIKFCNDEGLVRHKTVPGVPQQNGLAERMNRTLLERVRCMLSCANLPKKFWAEAVNTAVYLVNRCPSAALEFKTPEEIWTGVPPNYKNLRVFGCVAYAHIKQGKLEPRTRRCMFIGYPEGVKGYKLWYSDSNISKSFNSRDVTFREAEMYMSNSSSSSSNESSDIVTGVGIEVEQQNDFNSQSLQETTTSRNDIEDQRNNHLDDEEEIFYAQDELEGYQLARDRDRRERRAPQRYGYADLISFALSIAEDFGENEPKNFQEATKCNEKHLWLAAMQDEMKSLIKNHTWTLVNKPANHKLVGCKWIYKRKEGIAGVEKPRYKARLVAKGFTQKEGVDFNEIYSPVVKHTSIRVLLALVTQFGMELEQMDVKTAFLHGKLEEKIYMSQPDGFICKGNEDKVCLLERSLYGLKQSPRQWYLRFDEFMIKNEYTRSMYDSCVYFRNLKGKPMVFLLLYVDDMLIASTDIREINKLKSRLSMEFEMKDLGASKRILGMDISRDKKNNKLFVAQKGYVEKVLKKFGMTDSKVVQTPLAGHFKLSVSQSPTTEQEKKYMDKIPYASAVGSLMYSMVCTRPDLAYAASLVSRFMAKPGKPHWEAVKWVFRYLKGTSNLGLKYQKTDLKENALVGFVDSDYAGDLDKRRSLTGYVFTLFGCTVSWKATLQPVVALSTTEAEYIAATEAVKEALWLQGLIGELGIKPVTIKVPYT